MRHHLSNAAESSRGALANSTPHNVSTCLVWPLLLMKSTKFSSLITLKELTSVFPPIFCPFLVMPSVSLDSQKLNIGSAVPKLPNPSTIFDVFAGSFGPTL